jgi:hypothetical protein
VHLDSAAHITALVQAAGELDAEASSTPRRARGRLDGARWSSRSSSQACA